MDSVDLNQFESKVDANRFGSNKYAGPNFYSDIDTVSSFCISLNN